MSEWANECVFFFAFFFLRSLPFYLFKLSSFLLFFFRMPKQETDKVDWQCTLSYHVHVQNDVFSAQTHCGKMKKRHWRASEKLCECEMRILCMHVFVKRLQSTFNVSTGSIIYHRYKTRGAFILFCPESGGLHKRKSEQASEQTSKWRKTIEYKYIHK